MAAFTAPTAAYHQYDGPFSMTAAKTYSLPMKPTSGGMPISDSRKIAIATVSRGARR